MLAQDDGSAAMALSGFRTTLPVWPGDRLSPQRNSMLCPADARTHGGLVIPCHIA